jgi:phage terminase large subunit-like protein
MAAVQLVNPKGDKLARALAIQPLFSQGLIYAPVRDWSESLIVEASQFPMGRHDDQVDSMTQALQYLRNVGLGQSDSEVAAEREEAVRHRPRPRALYPC